MKKLYFKDGKEADAWDIMEWWLQKFPNPPYDYSPKYVVETRRLFEKQFEEMRDFSR